jgi:ABC-type nitrate/sulfonate/bicarbonate transport system ATPase subunit
VVPPLAARPARAVSAPAATLELRGLGKRYGELEVLRDLTLSVRAGELVAILGPSGCGKSTALAILTGGTAASAGEVLVDGAPLAGARAGRFAYMPQADALLPWRRVLDNATLGLEVRGVPRAQARERVRAVLPAFGLDGFERAYPFELSGGMRQRVALLRTIVQERDVLLLDEPFGALDALTRAEMQRWLSSIRERFRTTVLLVTHDVREAVFLADRIYVLSARPGTVVAELEVPFPRPRAPGDPAIARLEGELLERLLGAPPAGAAALPR